MEIIRSFKKRSLGTDFKFIENMRSLINEMKLLVSMVKEKQESLLLVTMSTAKDKIYLELEDLHAKFKTLRITVQSKLKAFEREINETKKHKNEAVIEIDNNPCGIHISPVALRIRKNQYAALMKEFTDVISEYHCSRLNHRDHIKCRLKRQLEIMEIAATDEDIEKMIEEGKCSAFTQNFLAQENHAIQMLADVEARHKDIVKLEKDLSELHELFLELALHLETQGDTVDRIENQVGNAVELTNVAKVELGKVEISKRKSRKRCLWMSVLLIILLFIIGVVILKKIVD